MSTLPLSLHPTHPHVTNPQPTSYTSGVLDTLAEYNARATFFINGQNFGPGLTDPASNFGALLQQMIDSGHQIGSHTWSHPDLSTLSAAQQRQQMAQLETTLLTMIGKYPTYMRPPFLSCDSSCLATMNSMGYHVIHTDLDSKDYAYKTPATNSQAQQIFDNAINAASPADRSFLTLMHEVHQTTAELLIPQALKTLTAKGFKVVPVVSFFSFVLLVLFLWDVITDAYGCRVSAWTTRPITGIGQYCKLSGGGNWDFKRWRGWTEHIRK